MKLTKLKSEEYYKIIDKAPFFSITIINSYSITICLTLRKNSMGLSFFVRLNIQMSINYLNDIYRDRGT